jgi:AraC family transcriptional regulator of adaptative response/methylated-DNA-[protein]-cysteine methyltransferase
MKPHNNILTLQSDQIDTPLGPMLAVASDKALYILAFVDQPGLDKAKEQLCKNANAIITPGSNKQINLIKQELKQYFTGKLKNFKTPIDFNIITHSDFKKTAWQALTAIPYGNTISYAAQACAINKPTAFRAVANANGSNILAIIVPCHRIINTNGKLGGYRGGIARKQWLINHENKYFNI